MIKLIRENPALFLGELRDDLIRFSAIDDETGIRYNVKAVGDETGETECSEVLIPYPNEVEYEPTEHPCKQE